MHKYQKIFVMIAALLFAVPGCGENADTSADSIVDPTTTTAPPTTLAPTTTSTTIATTTTSMIDEHQEQSGDEEHEEGAGGVDAVVEVSMTDFAFEPDAYEVVAGQSVKFVISNDGLVEHEFRLSNEHRIEEHMESGHEDHDDDGHHEADGDLFVIAQPGETVELVMTFPEDMSLYTEVACLLPGHYEAGMKAPVSYVGG